MSSLFGNACFRWCNFRYATLSRSVRGGVSKTFRWAT